MATKKEIEEHLQAALHEIGEIKPWYDEEVACWIFAHPLYPTVEYGGDSPEEVIQNYRFYLHDFIEARLTDHLSPIAEKQTKGRGGVRPGAGRPKKSHKTATQSVRLSEPLADVARWLKRHPEALPAIQQVMQRYA